MTLHFLPPLPPDGTPWRLDPEALYRIDGLEYRLLEPEEKGVHRFLGIAEGDKVSLSDPDLRAKHAGSALEIKPRYFSRQRAYLRSLNRDFMTGDLAPEERGRVMFTYLLCQGYDHALGEWNRGLRAEAVNLGKPCLDKLLPQIQAEIVATYNSRARKGDELVFKREPGSARQFCRDFRKFEKCREPEAFARLYRGSSTRKKRSDPLEYRIRLREQRRYASPRKPSMAAALKRYVSSVRLVNRWLERRGWPVLKAVTRNTFVAGIEAFDPFWVMMRREDEKAALARYGTGSGGYGLFRPLERVEFDEWKIDLVTLLVEAKVWEVMTSAERQAVQRSRLWATVAMDTATRCILALTLHHREPCGDTAVQTLELALTDKSAIARHVGATCSFPYAGKIETVLSDNGAAFRSERFLTATVDAGAELLLPQAGKPQARAHIERFFRTATDGGLHWFSGRTFSSVLEKGDADPEATATVCAESFARGFLLYAFQEYHHTPHAGLGLETPHDAWMRMTKKDPVEPPPTADAMRSIFGLEFERTVSNLGIRFMGFQYQSRDVQAHVGRKVTFRVDRYDMSRITFWDGLAWKDVEPELPVPRGLTVYEVEHAAREFRARFDARAALHLDFVADVARTMREIGDTADRVAGVNPLADRASERARLDRLDRERFGFRIGRAAARTASAPGPGILDLTAPRPATEAKVYELPSGYREAVRQRDPGRYDFGDEAKKEAAGAGPPAAPAPPPGGAHGFDDPDDIGFE